MPDRVPEREKEKPMGCERLGRMAIAMQRLDGRLTAEEWCDLLLEADEEAVAALPDAGREVLSDGS